MSHPSARYDRTGNLHLYSPSSNNRLSPCFPYPSNYPTWLSPPSNAVSSPSSSQSSTSPSHSSALSSPPSKQKSSTHQTPPRPHPSSPPLPFPPIGLLLAQHTTPSPVSSSTPTSS